MQQMDELKKAMAVAAFAAQVAERRGRYLREINRWDDYERWIVGQVIPEMGAAELAEWLQGQVSGDAVQVATPEEAQAPNAGTEGAGPDRT
jgi:hypothetical protein